MFQTLQTPPAPKQGDTVVKALLGAVIAVCAVGIAAGVVYLLRTYVIDPEPRTFDEAVALAARNVAADGDGGGQGALVDFDSLVQLAGNSDLYAWVHVLGTSVSSAVCQSPTDDAFYRDHDATGAQDPDGCVYSESSANGTAFADAVTVLYGNNNEDGTGFASLHSFEDADFFAGHDTVRVYTPGHVRIYRIVSAFTGDATPVMTRYYYFTKESKHKEFLKLIQDPTGLTVNKREVDGIGLDSNILVLSTYNGGALEENSRYLVCGVMVDDRAA